jgi:hypothetical protein
MDWRPIQISEIALYLLNAQNWKSPGNDQIQNYWLKAFPATHRHITKNFNAIIEETEKAPDWLTTGLTYLIPKSGNSKEVRNYRPITCLTTIYKTLTGIIAKRISTHLEEQSLLPAEQKGCHPASKGCKDQLMISKAIYKVCRRRNKNLSIAWIDYQKIFDSVPVHSTRRRFFFTITLQLELRKKLLKCYVWSIAFYGAETWTLRAVDQKPLKSFQMWWWRRM